MIAAHCPWRKVTPALALALLLAGVLTVLWAGPAAYAGAASAQQRSLVAKAPGSVKYYVVPAAGTGTAESLYEIAVLTLGDGSRYMEIFQLNKGRPQPNGARLEKPGEIDPGWILRLPADAAGPGVHFGPLPAPARPVTAPASDPPAPLAAASAAAKSSTGLLASLGAVAGVLAIAGLIAGIRRRRRLGASDSRNRGEIRTDGSRSPAGPGSATTGLSTHRANTQEVDVSWLQEFGGSDWPRWDSPPDLPPDHPSAPMPRVTTDQLDGRLDGRVDDRLDGRGIPGGRTGGAGPTGGAGNGLAGGSGGGDRRRAQGANVTGWQPPADGATFSDEFAGGYVRRQTVPTRPQQADGYLATPPRARAEPRSQFVIDQADPLGDRARFDRRDPRAGDSLWLTDRVLAEANQHAAEVILQAQDQASSIRAAAWQAAADIRQQAADQAAALLSAAELDAEQMRTAALTVSAELGQVAAYVTENLTRSPARQVIRPPALPALEPAPQPAAKPAPEPPRRGSQRAKAPPGQ